MNFEVGDLIELHKRFSCKDDDSDTEASINAILANNFAPAIPRGKVVGVDDDDDMLYVDFLVGKYYVDADCVRLQMTPPTAKEVAEAIKSILGE